MPTRARLTHDRIVDAAIKLVDEEGVDAFSMRNLAAQLGVDAMAIYHHHKNKLALTHALVQALMAKCELPSPSADWRDDFRAICRNFRALAHKHPGAFLLYVYHEEWAASEFNVFEALLETLLRAGFSQKSAVRSMRMTLMFIEGFTEDEINGWMEEEDIAELQDVVTADNLPTLYSALAEFVAYDHEAEFEDGLNVLVNGFEAALRC